MKWADNLLVDMGFRPCKAYPDLWMRSKANYYEYVAVMVDDLLVFSREPELIIEPIIDHAASYLFNYDLNGAGQDEYLLHTPLNDMPPMIIPAPSIPPEPPPPP